jgi:hypothetical protein
MKVTLFSCWSNLSLSVSIRQDMKAAFIELLKLSSNSALNAILADVDYFCEGYEPIYITKYTAKRIATFFGTDTNYFNRLEYAHR